MPQALAVLVTTALLLPSLLLAASMNAAAHNGTHGTETDPGFWNVVEGWSTKTGFRLLFFWDADAPVAGIVSWGYSEDAMTNVARPLADVVDTAQMAIVDIPRSAVVPGARVHFKVTDVITGSESPVKSFRVGNAWTSSAADGVYEVNAILQLDSEALPDSLPWDQGVRNLADGVKILSERIWDATDGYVRIGRVLVTDTNLNYPANFPGAIPVGLQGAPGPLGGRGFCVGDDPQSVEGVETQNTLADFLVMTSMPFDSHTWRAAIDDPCTPFWIGRAGQLIIPWEDDLHLGSTMAHEFGHYALDLDDLYPVEDFTSGRGCKVGINGPPDNAAGQYDISLMHNQGGWSGSRWTQTELDRLSTPCNREGGDPSWPALAARYPAIPATGRLGNDMPDHGDSDYTKPRGNPNGGALDIFILDNTPGASKVEHYVKGTPVNDDPVDPDGVPEITIASPAAGATVPPATVNVAGSVDREASATNAAPTATLTASPTSGTEPLEVTFNLEASDSDGTVVSWSFSPGDGAAATTGTGGPSPTLTHTYTVPGDHVATLTVTDNEGATGTATRTIKVGAPAGRSLIGTDPAGDTVTGSCNGTTACDPAWIAGAKDGLDLKAAYIEPAGENIRFTIEVVDAADFFVDPSGDPATGASHIVAYQIEIPFQTSPGTQYTASISRDRGATEITGSLGKFFGAAGVGLTSSAAIPDSAKVNFAANRFTLDIPKSSFTELALLSTFSGLNATASILQEGTGNVRLTSPIDEGLESVPNPTYTVQASASPAGFGLNPSATLAPPSSPPANPQVTDPQGDNFGGSAVTHSDIVSAWFENDDEYLYVGLEVADIPADPTTTAQIGYEVLFKPTWTSDWEGVVGEFTGLGVSAVLSAVHFNLNTLGTGTVAPTNGTHRFELVVHSTDGATDNFNILGEIPLSSADADSDIFWFVVPRTMLQNPAPGATLTELGAVSQAAVGGLLTWSTVGDTATSGASYALKGTTGPLTADAGGPYPGAAGAPVSLAGTATGGAEPYACAWSGAGATFANANACATTATYAAEGTYEVTLTVTDDAGTVATDTASVGIGASNSERVEVYVDGETVPRGIVPVTTSATNPVASWNVNVDLSGLTGAHTLTARWYDAAGTLLDSDAVQVSVTPTGAPVVEITTPEDASTQSGVIAVEGTAGHGAAATLADGRLAFDPDSLFMARAASETRSGHIFAFCSGCQGSPLTGADLGTSTAWLFGASSPFNGADGVWLDVAGLVGSEFVLTAEFNSPADVWFFNSDLDTQDLATGNVVGGQMPKTGTVPPGTNWAFVYLRRPTQQNAADLVAFDDTVTLTLSAPRSVPSAPQALTASPGATSITLSWQAPASDGGSPITGYKVYRDQNAPVTVPATQTSYVDTGLAPLTRYSYNVTAVNAIGESLRAGPVSARTTSTGPDTEAPSAVTDLAVTGTTATTVSLAWNASTDNVGVARYNVHRGSSADFTPTAANRVGAPEGTTFTESGLAPGGTYHYKVAAVDDAGNVGPASAPVAATTPATGAGELVTLTVDGAFHAALVPENGVWATTLDTRTLAPGTHTLTATYDDGLGGSDTDSVTIVVDNPQETPGLAIVSPAEGADVAAPVTFAGTYDLPGDDGPAPVRGMRLDDALPDPTEAWLADPFVQSVLKAPSYKTLVQTFSSSPGFGGAVPMPTADGAGKILVLFRGEKPVNAETLWQGAWNLQFLEHQVPQVLRQEAARAATPISLEAFEAMMANAQGPPTPGIQAGVGPGTAMQQGFGASTYICTASYLFENPATGKYYLGTAGHCLLDETSMSSVSNPAGRANYIDLCYADCISNMVGLGQYVRLAPNPATGYHPVAFAQQWDGTPDNDVGTDFGLIEIPASVYQYLRPYMWVWGGPDSYARPLNGDVLTHYGHGAYYAATPASQARLHVGLFTSAAREVAFLGVIWGGDSGSALGIGEVGGDGLFYGAAATGTLTHGLGIQEPLLGTGFGVPLLLASGTDLQRGLDMAEPHLGFRPVLVTGGATIREPGDPTATPLKATITSPAEDAVFDGNTVTSVTVQGTATFPAGSGPGTGSRTYYMHRTLCGAGGILFMDETKLATEAGDGCGNFAHPVGPALSALGAPLSSVFPANPKPGTDIAVDRTRPITASFYLTPYIGDGLIPPAVVYDYEFRLTAGGVLIGSERITSSPVATAVDPWANFSFMALEDTIPAGSDLTATFIVHHAVGPVFMAHGGDLSPTVAIPLGAASTQAVEVSVDDPTFAPGSLLPVTGTTAWSATWPLASVADGEHTLYARALKNGVPQTGAATVNVTVTRTEDVPPTAAFTADATGRLVAFTDASTPGSTPITAWSWSFGDGNTASTQNAAHRYTADGTYTATLTVTDANGLTATASAPVTVLANAWELQVRIVDAASTVHVPWTAVKEMADGEDGQWTYTWDPAARPAEGAYTLEARILQNGVPVATATRTVNHLPNTAPELDAVGAKTVNENATLAFTLTATDADGDAITYEATGLPAGATLSPAGAFAWTPDFTQAGDHLVTFRVTDGDLSDSEEVTLTVVNVNQAPVIAPIPNQAVLESATLQVVVDASDPDGDALTLSASGLPAGATFDAETRTLTWTPEFGRAGTYPGITVSATDGALTATRTFTITVLDVNRGPVLGPLTDANVTEASLLAFTVTGADPDGDTLTYSAANLPAGAGFNGTSGQFSWTPTYDQAGVYENVTFSVTDGNTTDAASIRIVVVNLNRAPVPAAVPDQSGAERGTLAFTLSAADPDNDTLAFNADTLPEGATLDAATGAFQWTPGYEAAGFYQLGFAVSDGEARVPVTVNLTVTDTPAPIVNKATGKGYDTLGEATAAATAGETILVRPGTYNEAVTLAKPGLTLCRAGPNSTDCDDTAGEARISGGTRPAVVITASDVTVKGFTLTIHGSAVQVTGTATNPVRGVILEGNTLPLPGDATSAAHGIRLLHTRDVVLRNNTIRASITPGSQAIGIERSVAPVISGNTIHGGNVAITLVESTGATVTGNTLVGAPANALGAETTALHAHLGGGHVFSDNAVTGASYGLLVVGASNVAVDGGTFTETATGIVLRNLGATQPHGFRVNNATLPDTANKLVLDTGTRNLNVDARYNYWGAFTRTSITAASIRDRGVGNVVNVDCFIDRDGVNAICPPTVAFATSAPRPAAPVQFTDGTKSGGRDLLTWSWSFGDGATSTERNPVHTYSAMGTYPVTLTVTDAEGYQASRTEQVAVTSLAPIIGNLQDVTIGEGQSLTIPVTATDPEGDRVTLAAAKTPAGASFSATGASGTLAWTPAYHQAGEHLVTLTATDEHGARAERTFRVTVANVALAPEARPDVPAHAMPGKDLTLADRSVDPDGGRIVAWRWDLGQGATSTERAPIVRFASEGLHTVSLTVTDDEGDTATATRTLLVDGTAPEAEAALEGVNEDGFAKDTVRITLGGTDAASGLKSMVYRLDGANPVTVPAGTVLAVDAAGAHEIEYWAVDNAGNLAPAKALSFIVDNAGPTASIVSPGKASLSGRVTFTADAVDEASGIERVTFYLDGTKIASFNAKDSLTHTRSVGTGIHTFRVVAVDRVGHVTETEREFAVAWIL